MHEALIIGDIAGQFDALMRLVAHVPETCPILSVGDLVDRGPQSADVVAWFMKTERAYAVKGNHEDLMVDHYREGVQKYRRGTWLMNGGGYTIRSYDDYPDGVSPEHIAWLDALPLYRWVGHDFAGGPAKCLVTHAPIHARFPDLAHAVAFDPEDVWDPSFEDSLLWNRSAPRKRPGAFQVFGHNSHWGLKSFQEPGDTGAYALCIDTSRDHVLTGFHWPSCEVFQENYERPE